LAKKTGFDPEAMLAPDLTGLAKDPAPETGALAEDSILNNFKKKEEAKNETSSRRCATDSLWH
jgi:hypothetical protein